MTRLRAGNGLSGMICTMLSLFSIALQTLSSTLLREDWSCVIVHCDIAWKNCGSSSQDGHEGDGCTGALAADKIYEMNSTRQYRSEVTQLYCLAETCPKLS